jgi:hypothetical protein
MNPPQKVPLGSFIEILGGEGHVGPLERSGQSFERITKDQFKRFAGSGERVAYRPAARPIILSDQYFDGFYDRLSLLY